MHREFGNWLDDFAAVLVPNQTAIDIGCGHGDDTLTLLNAGLSVVAFDVDPDRVSNAATRAPAASCVAADLRSGIPLCDAVADVAIASLSLHYFDRQTTDSILRDLRRVTRRGATLLARVNVVGDQISRWGVGTERERDYFEVQPGEFKRFFTEETLQEAIDPHFAIDELYRRTTLVQEQHPKQTLVVRAIRHDD